MGKPPGTPGKGTTKVPGPQMGEIPTHFRNQKKPVWLEFNEEERVGYVGRQNLQNL